MVSEPDLAFFEAAAKGLPEGAVVVEFGPWLGAISAVVAPYCDLHVVDNFRWTRAHAKKVPDLDVPDNNFRPAFERTLSDRDLGATIHETDFAAFQWEGGPIDMVIVDGPKKPTDLADCLGGVLSSVAPGGRIHIKNGLAPAYPDLATYVGELMSGGTVEVACETVAADNNILSLSVPDGDTRNRLDEAKAGPLPGLRLAPDHPYHLAALVAAIEAGDFQRAYHKLAGLAPSRRLIAVWEKLEQRLVRKASPKEVAQIAIFSDILAVHNTAIRKNVPVPFNASANVGLRAYWLNNVDRRELASRISPEIISQAHAFGYFGFANRIRAHVHGKSVLDVGCGPGLHGIGFLVAGATSYLGLDPIVRPDRDRAKNLRRRAHEPFGMTANEIMEALPHWQVRDLPIEDTPLSANFEVATLHNVTEHLQNLESVVSAIAERLVPGGHLIFNHHNFYCWNGHHLPPKRVSDYDPSDPAQYELADWRHIDFDPPEGHYIGRGLNRVRLDELIDLTRRYFDILELEDRPASEENGGGRLTDAIRARHPDLTDRDFLTHNLFCVARVKDRPIR